MQVGGLGSCRWWFKWSSGLHGVVVGIDRCFTYKNIGVEKSVGPNDSPVKLDFRLDCNSENVIYLCIYKHDFGRFRQGSDMKMNVGEM